jgi:hypothetical protein
MRRLYRNWRPTRLGRLVNRFSGWWSGLGLPPRFMAVPRGPGPQIRPQPLEPRGDRHRGRQLLPRIDARPRVGLGENVEAAQGDAVIRQGGRRRVHLVAVPPEQRAPVLREYVRIASSGRQHFPLPVGPPLSDFDAIAGRYPVYRIDPWESDLPGWLLRGGGLEHV